MEQNKLKGIPPGPWIVVPYMDTNAAGKKYQRYAIEWRDTGGAVAIRRTICEISPTQSEDAELEKQIATVMASAPELLKERDSLKEKYATYHSNKEFMYLNDHYTECQSLNAELLEALKKIAESSEPNKADARGFQAIAKAAIAKAEGRATV